MSALLKIPQRQDSIELAAFRFLGTGTSKRTSSRSGSTLPLSFGSPLFFAFPILLLSQRYVPEYHNLLCDGNTYVPGTPIQRLVGGAVSPLQIVGALFATGRGLHAL